MSTFGWFRRKGWYLGFSGPSTFPSTIIVLTTVFVVLATFLL